MNGDAARCKDRGFTLLELIIAIAIMSLVLAALYSTFSLASRAMLDADGSLVRLQESRAFVDVLRREIESLLFDPNKSYETFRIDDRDFYGRQASSITMTTLSPVMKGLSRVTYSVEDRNGTLVVTKSMTSAFSQTGDENRTDLLEGIESFTLQAKYGDSWVKTWDSAMSKDVPDEVRITVNVSIKGNKGDRTVAPLSLSETAKPRNGKTL